MRALGKLLPKHDVRTFKLERFAPKFPVNPVSSDWTIGINRPWEDFMNSQFGCCTCAGGGHLIMIWTANTSNIYVPTTDQILGAYSDITGFKASDPTTDNGAAELDVLNYWRNIGIAGHKILAYMKLDPKNIEQIKSAIHLFGGAYVGVAMPDSWEGQIDNNEPWTWSLTDKPNFDNGHALPLIAYDAFGPTCITWGQKQKMSWEWFVNCADEAYVILSPDWLMNGYAPSALDVNALQNALKAL